MKPKHSFKDKNNLLWVACSECEKGLNGTIVDKCSSAKKKQFNGSGCFAGTLMKEYDKVPDDYVEKFMSCFNAKTVTRFNEIILNKKWNIFINVKESVVNEFDLKVKAINWLSRPSHKGVDNKTQDFILSGLNKFLGTFFNKDAMDIIYTRLGNAVNTPLTKKFIESKYDMELLKKD